MRIARYLREVIAYSIRSSRWVYVVLFFALFGTILEFAALSVLVPLTQYINHSRMSVIAHYWNDLLAAAGCSSRTRHWCRAYRAT